MHKKILKSILRLGIVLALVLAGLYIYIFVVPVKESSLYKSLPKDAIFIAEVNKPIDRWDDFKESPVWQFLKTNEHLGLVHKRVDRLHRLIEPNKSYFKLLVKSDMLISGHMLHRQDYSYLYSFNLGKASKLGGMGRFRDFIIKQMNFKPLKKQYKDVEIVGFGSSDPEDNFWICLLDNNLLLAYHIELLHRAIDTYGDDQLPDLSKFAEVESETKNSGIARLYLQHDFVDDFLGVYSQNTPIALKLALSSMAFTGFNMNVEDEVELSGFTNPSERVPNILQTLSYSGKSKMMAPDLLPSETAIGASMCFEDPESMKAALFELSGKPKLKVLFRLLGWESKNPGPTKFEDWVNREIIFGMVPIQRGYSSFIILPEVPKHDEIKESLKRYDKGLTGVGTLFSKKSKEHKGVRIRTLPIKAVLNQLLGAKVYLSEKPTFGFLDEHLVVCDDRETLVKIIDGVREGTALNSSAVYQGIEKQLSSENSLWVFVDTKRALNWLKGKVVGTHNSAWHYHQAYLLGFPAISLQMISLKNGLKTNLYASFENN